MRRPRPLCCLPVLAAMFACQQVSPPPREQPTPATPAAPAALPAPAATPTPPPSPEPPPAEPPPASEPDEPPPSSAASYSRGPLAATAVDRGVLVVWSRHDGAANKSEILALLLDDRGRARGEPRLVRRTSGDVVDLDVHRRDGAAWIAWAAHLSPDSDPPRALIAAVHIEPDLSAMHPPISLHQFASQDLGAWPERDHVRVLALADGAAAIATVSSSAVCTDIVTDRRGKCPGYEVRWARPDGTSSLAGKFGADGGDPDMLDLVDIGTGVVSTIYAWHGGATYGHLYAPYHAAAAASLVPLHDCRPPFTRAWTGDELVTICPDDYADEKEACKLNGVSAESGACTRVHTAVKGDRAVALVSEKRRCEGGHPVIDLAWKGGKIRLDPSAPGASMAPVLGVWTGTNAVKVTTDGARELWTCNKSGELVAGEPIDDTLALDPDPTPLQSIPAHRP